MSPAQHTGDFRLLRTVVVWRGTVRDIENAGGKAYFIAADLSDADDVRRLAAEAGPVDILVNSAGVYRFAATVDTDDADFADHLNTNLRAPYILVQRLVPGMVERGHGSVVNVTTVAASTPAAGAGIYGASKAGLELLTKGLGRTTAIGRTADVDEIANAVTFLASPAASYVNGTVLTIGGGAQAIKPAA